MKTLIAFFWLATTCFAYDSYVLDAKWVDDRLVVYVNEIQVYSFIQPSTSNRDTSFDLTNFLKRGNNLVRLEVYDTGRVWWNADFKIYINNDLYWQDHEFGDSNYNDPELRYNKIIQIYKK
jgi:hypothetical protein